jgi:hypothetical protein
MGKHRSSYPATGSPAWVEKILSQWEQGLVERLSIAMSGAAPLLLWPLLGLGLLAYQNQAKDWVDLLGNQYYSLVLKAPILAYLFLSWPLLRFLRSSGHWWLQPLIPAMLLLAFPPAHSSSWAMGLSMGIVYIGFSSCLLWPRNWQGWWLVVFLVSSLLTITLAYLSRLPSNSGPDFGWWIVRPAYFLLPVAVLWHERKNTLALQASYFLNPAQWIFTQPFPISNFCVSDQKTEDSRLAAQALFDILLGISVVALLLLLWLKMGPNISWKGLEGALWAHFFLFFSTWALARLCVGLGRYLGFRFPDIYHFPLLATSPAELWRRWNTYLYRWSVNFIYIPIYRRTSSVALAVFAVFALHGYTHGAIDLAYFLLSNAPFSLRNVWYQLQPELVGASLVCLSLWTKKWWPPSDSRVSWWGVLFTQGAILLAYWR